MTVAALHAHVMGLHRAFLEGLPAAGHPTIHPGALVGLQVRPGCWGWPLRSAPCLHVCPRHCQPPLCPCPALPQDESCRSHTLVFAQPSAEAARAAVEALARQGVLVDCRKACLRVGFGANHSASDVAALLAALKAAAAAASG